MEKNTNQKLQQLVNEWNEKYPVGTPVTRYKLVDPLREPEQTMTCSEAWLMGEHTAVVKVAGVAGGVELESIRINEEVPPPNPPPSGDMGKTEEVPPPNPPPAGDMGKTHELKCWPKYFEAIVYGKKHFEVRYDDRGYRIGDTLILREYDNDKKEYTGRQTRVKVMDIFADFGLQPGWVVMSQAGL